MRIYKAEDYIENLDRIQLLAMMDRIIRAVADRGYFGDKIALDEISRIITRKDDEFNSIEAGRRLFPEEIDEEGNRTIVKSE